ncbi:MAG TPA: NUDIX hydrolase N-terminal domain-containing protein [Rhizomicrobium sp.]
MQPKWLLWARELQAAAQNGLTYSENPYDRARYAAMQALAARIMAEGSGTDLAVIEGLFAQQAGYATPKVDVRGAIFRERSVLLVSETIDGGRWTMPGGFADVNEAPSVSLVREVREEAGYVVTARKLAAVYDRDKHGHPHPHPFHIYKLFFICDIVGRCEKSDLETGEPQFFPLDALPELSESRTLPWQIQRMYEHHLSPSLPTDFD